MLQNADFEKTSKEKYPFGTLYTYDNGIKVLYTPNKKARQ